MYLVIWSKINCPTPQSEWNNFRLQQCREKGIAVVVQNEWSEGKEE